MRNDIAMGQRKKDHIHLDNSPNYQFSDSQDFVLLTALSLPLQQ